MEKPSAQNHMDDMHPKFNLTSIAIDDDAVGLENVLLPTKTDIPMSQTPMQMPMRKMGCDDSTTRFLRYHHVQTAKTTADIIMTAATVTKVRITAGCTSFRSTTTGGSCGGGIVVYPL